MSDAIDESLLSIRTILPMNADEERAFREICHVRAIRKKEFVFREGDVPSRLYFVVRGLLHVFFTAKDDLKICRFFSGGEWYTDFAGYEKGERTSENFQALEDSELIQIQKKELEGVYRRYPNLERAGRVLAERALTGIHERNKMLTLEDPEVRYLRLLDEKPGLIERIPQYYLASYLNIKPESLSRIKKRLATKD